VTVEYLAACCAVETDLGRKGRIVHGQPRSVSPALVWERRAREGTSSRHFPPATRRERSEGAWRWGKSKAQSASGWGQQESTRRAESAAKEHGAARLVTLGRRTSRWRSSPHGFGGIGGNGARLGTHSPQPMRMLNPKNWMPLPSA
jgi:hypothetical protein